MSCFTIAKDERAIVEVMLKPKIESWIREHAEEVHAVPFVYGQCVAPTTMHRIMVRYDINKRTYSYVVSDNFGQDGIFNNLWRPLCNGDAKEDKWEYA